MSRNIDTATQTGLAGRTVPIAVLVDLTTSTGITHAWSGYGDLAYNAVTYLGVGHLGKVSAISETNAVYASNCTLTLEGIDTATIGEALTLPIGLPATVYLAVMSYPSGIPTVEGTAVPIFAGLTDQTSISESTTGSTIQIDIESKMAQLQRSRELRYTDQNQRYFYPNDSAFKYVNVLCDYIGTWGYQGDGL